LGKVLNGDHPGSHALAAADLLRSYGEDPKVINAVAAHHHEVPEESVYASLLVIADAASAARPGARSESIEGYLSRVKSLEDLARGFPGVVEAYAVQAGREVRVIVAPERITDDQARQLAIDLRRRIEDGLNFQGAVKITVIRESRFNEVAK
jgi:ribonuclease Y